MLLVLYFENERNWKFCVYFILFYSSFYHFNGSCFFSSCIFLVFILNKKNHVKIIEEIILNHKTRNTFIFYCHNRALTILFIFSCCFCCNASCRSCGTYRKRLSYSEYNIIEWSGKRHFVCCCDKSCANEFGKLMLSHVWC